MSGYTQIPNCLLDSMAEMQPSEFKALMAVYRLIMGYEEHREKRRRRLSLSRLVEYTGLSRQGVINATESLEKNGYLTKKTGNGVTEWVVNSVYSSGQLSVPDQSTQYTEPVDSVDRDSQMSVPPSNKRKPTKENLERKDTKEKEYSHFLKEWERLFPNKAQPRDNNKSLKKKLSARLENKHFVENWIAALERASLSDFCNSSGWFDAGWFLKNDEHYERCLNGKYDNPKLNGARKFDPRDNADITVDTNGQRTVKARWKPV